MSITSTSYQLNLSATDTVTNGATATSAVTSALETYSYTNGTAAQQITAVIDKTITLAAGSNTQTFSSLTTTSGGTFSATMLKGVRIRSASTNSAVTVGTNIANAPISGVYPGGTTLAIASQDANGWTISGTSNITLTGTTGNTVNLTLLVS